MTQPQIRPEKIGTPIQLLAAVLVFVIVVDGAFLTAAASITEPTWAAGTLVVAAVAITVLAPGGVVWLQTKHRDSLLSDNAYLRLEGRATRSTKDAVKLASERGKKVDVVGNPDEMALLFKAEGEGWLKSTKAMNVPGGCVVQVSTEVADRAGVAVAEALTFVPDGVVVGDKSGAHIGTST